MTKFLKPQKAVPVCIRIPPDVHRNLRAAAKKSKRSLNSIVVDRLSAPETEALSKAFIVEAIEAALDKREAR